MPKTKETKNEKVVKTVKADKKEVKGKTAKATPVKRGKTLSSKLNDVLYRTFSNDMLGSGGEPGVLAQVVSDAGAMTPQQAELLLKEFVDSRFGKTHKTNNFALWANEHRGKIKADLEKAGLPSGMGDVTKKLGEQWKQVSADVKAQWSAKAVAYNEEHGVRDFSPVPKARTTPEKAEKAVKAKTPAKAKKAVTKTEDSDSDSDSE